MESTRLSAAAMPAVCRAGAFSMMAAIAASGARSKKSRGERFMSRWARLVAEEGEINQDDAAEAEEIGVALQAAGLEQPEQFAHAHAEVGRAADDQAVEDPTVDPVQKPGEHLLPTDQAAIIELVEVEFIGEHADIERIGRYAPIDERRRDQAENHD